MTPPHMSSADAGCRTTPRPTTSLANRPSRPSWVSGFGRIGGAIGDVIRKSGEQRAPFAFVGADDLIIGALAADILVGGNGGEDRDAGCLGKRLRLTRAIVLVDDHAGDADVAAELAEIFDRRTDVVGDVQRLQDRSSRRR